MKNVVADELLPYRQNAIVNFLAHNGHISREQVRYAQRVYDKMPSPKSVLSIILDLGYITKPFIEEALRSQKLDVPLEALVLEADFVSQRDMLQAVTAHKSDNSKPIIDILLSTHAITSENYMKALSWVTGIKHVSVDLSQLDYEEIQRTSTPFLEKQCVLPSVDKKGRKFVICPDSKTAEESDFVKGLVARNYVPVIAPKAEIVSAFKYLAEHAKKDQDPALYDETTAVGVLNLAIENAVRSKASDIHFEPMKDRLRIRFRRDGVMMLFKDLSADLAASVAGRVKALAQMNVAEKRKHQDGRIAFENRSRGIAIELRISTYVSIYGEKIVMRLLDNKSTVLEMSEIGMSKNILNDFTQSALDAPGGVVLVTGPTGAGKTTTLYAAINHLKGLDTSIITAEDPVEYNIDGVTQCSIKKEIGLTYEETLRSIVRQDPDVIVIGEIRDSLSAATAIQAALTGHKIISTLHTNDAIGALARLSNFDIESFLISSCVISIVAQRLLRRVCPTCAAPYTPDRADLRKIGMSEKDVESATFMVGRGCDDCCYTGYMGRMGVFEVLILNEQLQAAVLDNQTAHRLREIAIETSPFITLFEDGLAKAARGIISLTDVIRYLPKLGQPRPLNQIRRILGE